MHDCDWALHNLGHEEGSSSKSAHVVQVVCLIELVVCGTGSENTVVCINCSVTEMAASLPTCRIGDVAGSATRLAQVAVLGTVSLTLARVVHLERQRTEAAGWTDGHRQTVKRTTT